LRFALALEKENEKTSRVCAKSKMKRKEKVWKSISYANSPSLDTDRGMNARPFVGEWMAPKGETQATRNPIQETSEQTNKQIEKHIKQIKPKTKITKQQTSHRCPSNHHCPVPDVVLAMGTPLALDCASLTTRFWLGCFLNFGSFFQTLEVSHVEWETYSAQPKHTLQYNTTQMRCNTTQHNAMQYNTTQHNTTQYNSIQCIKV
jgi:hypothetical protein